MRTFELADSNVNETLGVSLCLGFSFFAGVFQGFFGCLLAWIAARKPVDGGREPAWLRHLNIAGVVGSATLPGVLSIAALAFGAISTVVVVRSASILIFNVLFTRVFRLGHIKQLDAIGTLLCVLGIVALFKVAPTDSSVTDSDFITLLSTPVSIGWTVVLGASCVACMAAVLVLERRRRRGGGGAADGGGSGSGGAPSVSSSRRDKRSAAGARRQPFARAALVSIVVACSSACMDLSAKGYTGSMANRASNFLASPTFWACLLAFVASAIVMRGSYVYGCKACNVLVFIPLNTLLSIGVSAATGFCVMEEWRTISEWDTFVTSYLVIFLGINLLCSKEARDQVSSVGSERASATLLEVQQLCTDMYTTSDKAMAITKFEQLVQKACQLGEVESNELVALVVALLNELPELPKSLIGDWLQLAYPTIFRYVQDTSSTPGPQRHSRNRLASPLPQQFNRFLPLGVRRYGYRAMLTPYWGDGGSLPPSRNPSANTGSAMADPNEVELGRADSGGALGGGGGACSGYSPEIIRIGWGDEDGRAGPADGPRAADADDGAHAAERNWPPPSSPAAPREGADAGADSTAAAASAERHTPGGGVACTPPHPSSLATAPSSPRCASNGGAAESDAVPAAEPSPALGGSCADAAGAGGAPLNGARHTLPLSPRARGAGGGGAGGGASEDEERAAGAGARAGAAVERGALCAAADGAAHASAHCPAVGAGGGVAVGRRCRAASAGSGHRDRDSY